MISPFRKCIINEFCSLPSVHIGIIVLQNGAADGVIVLKIYFLLLHTVETSSPSPALLVVKTMEKQILDILIRGARGGRQFNRFLALAFFPSGEHLILRCSSLQLSLDRTALNLRCLAFLTLISSSKWSDREIGRMRAREKDENVFSIHPHPNSFSLLSSSSCFYRKNPFWFENYALIEFPPPSPILAPLFYRVRSTSGLSFCWSSYIFCSFLVHTFDRFIHSFIRTSKNASTLPSALVITSIRSCL